MSSSKKAWIVALAILAFIGMAGPASAEQVRLIDVSYTGGNYVVLQPGSSVELGRASVPQHLIGASCSLNVVIGNNHSQNKGYDLVINYGGTPIIISNPEIGPSQNPREIGVIGSVVSISAVSRQLDDGEWPTVSATFEVTISCQSPPASTTTTAAPATTEPPASTTTTEPPSTTEPPASVPPTTVSPKEPPASTTTTAAPTSTTTTVVSVTTEPPSEQPPEDELAKTGNETFVLVGLGITMLLAGFAASMGRKRLLR